MPSPVSLEHSHRHAVIMGWLLNYLAATPGLKLLDNATVRLDAENEVQPDAALYVIGGRAQEVGGFLHGAPELVVEIATTSAAYDLHEKLRVYRRTGVLEYVVHLTHERETLWHRLNEGRYDVVAPDADGVIRSQAFPGLWFNSGQFWADDLSRLLATLQEGLTTAEHEAFAASLLPEQ